ncbi:hypothetical protein [Motiliproteus sp. MSK22-1]|uniref:hypothetical protein n=1 Tax=Motiliproteus sp. MSK22-1 TaxID=1897630 RepID=UPI000976A7C0|nr:hypothetical protein [Motiliproteus sp. MSK22-1]OMH39057.1 hypothetical protein BGP75_04905 [Motiliproteus sp. MSK22-1]
MLTEFRQKRADHALRKALGNNSPGELLKAIRKGANTNQAFSLTEDTSPQLPIICALIKQDPECLALLLESGAELPTADADQLSLMSLAIQSKEAPLALLTTLLSQGINANAKAGSAFFCCLDIEDDNLKLLLITRLIEHGGNINVRNSNNSSPLEVLLQQEKTALVGALISAGAQLPESLDQLSCSEEMKVYARRKQQDLATQKLLLGST